MEIHLTTADVYETASLIGKDMEQIMENFGHDVVVDIMPKIINWRWLLESKRRAAWRWKR